MKKLLFIILLALPFFGNAQIIYSDGKLGVNDTTMNSTFPWTIKDWSGLDWTNGKKNCFRIDLSSNRELRLTGSNNAISFPNLNKVGFNKLYVGSLYQYSDNRQLINPTPVQSGLGRVLKLKPITYETTTYNMDVIGIFNSGDDQASQQNNSMIPDKDVFCWVGFDVKELQPVFPNLVATDNEGFKFINYSLLIPYMVKAIQELNQIVEDQAEEIRELKAGSGTQKVRNRINGRIAQCSPNPTPGLISVYLEIDESANSAELRVSSVSGNVELSKAITPDEKYVDMDLSHLTSGVHVLSLYIDGILADSIQIIKE